MMISVQNRQSNTGWNLPLNLNYHFIGIGGVAMGNVAISLVKCGFKVSGSDQKIYSPMKELLEEVNIVPLTPYSPLNIEGKDLLIIGNAISRGNPELEAGLDRRMNYVSLPEFLRWGILKGRKNLVVTGTHGKTTTAALLSFILAKGGYRPGYLIGGAPVDFPAGFDSGEGEFFVIEGDEYDIAFFDKRAKFLQYLPYAVIINNLEFDHGDIYRNLGEIQDAFRKLLRLIPQNGLLVINGDDGGIKPIMTEARGPVITFGTGESNLYTGKLINGRIFVSRDKAPYCEFRFLPPGKHNMLNALSALALCDWLGLKKDAIVNGLEKFRGVRRRMELVGEVAGIQVIDDFAHHPTAVCASLQALRENYPQSRIWAIFQPRSNTSVTNVFQREWVQAFTGADKVVIAELHRRDSIPPEKRLKRDLLKADLNAKGVETFLWDTADEIVLNIINQLRKDDIVLIMSNSDFEGLAKKLFHSL